MVRDGETTAVPTNVRGENEERARPSGVVPLRGIDVYRTDAFDAERVEARLGDDIRAVLGHEGDDGSPTAIQR